MTDGRVAVITGGESGIGLATARLFAASGARVFLIGLRPDLLAAAVDGLGAERAAFAVADVTDEAAVQAAMGAAHERFGAFDALFSNAGIAGPIAPITEYPSADFARVLSVHVLGAFHVLKHGLPRMRDGGAVVINSSVVGLTSDPGVSGYATAKHAQVGLMRTAAKECAARGIRVNTIHPGPTSTPFQDAIETAATGLPQAEASRAFEEMIPLRRHATPEEIARTVHFLCGDGASFITGATIATDGGMSV